MKARALAALSAAAACTAQAFELVLVVAALIAVVVVAIGIVAVRTLARVIDWRIVDATMQEMFALALGPFVPKVVDKLGDAPLVTNHADGSLEVATRERGVWSDGISGPAADSVISNAAEEAAAEQPIRREDYINADTAARVASQRQQV